MKRKRDPRAPLAILALIASGIISALPDSLNGYLLQIDFAELLPTVTLGSVFLLFWLSKSGPFRMKMLDEEHPSTQLSFSSDPVPKIETLLGQRSVLIGQGLWLFHAPPRLLSWGFFHLIELRPNLGHGVYVLHTFPRLSITDSKLVQQEHQTLLQELEGSHASKRAS